MLDRDCQLSVRCQCKLLNIHRFFVYSRRRGESAKNLRAMELIDRQHLIDPAAGVRRMSLYLSEITGKKVCVKRVRRLMRNMGVEAVYPQARTTIPGGPAGIVPYLLKDMEIDHANQVWSMDGSYSKRHKYYFDLYRKPNNVDPSIKSGKLQNNNYVKSIP
ncbi:MAG: IS3 family transposase [Desulfobulbaceae bacterium]|jgi:putative transposase|nr:IS3 family transposase [Desulfobulbaceae bacterium]